MSVPENGLDRAFARMRQEQRLGLLPYFMSGFPDLDTSARLLDAAAEAGIDGVELGVPFSDPLADGVSIQRAGSRALENGVTLAHSLELAAGLRKKHDIGIVLMSYINPLLAYGVDRICADAAQAGVDGFIVPDLPLEEAVEFQEQCTRQGLHYVFLVAPTTPDDRLKIVGERASGFVYCVALLGTTGARTEMSGELEPLVDRVRDFIKVPLVAGFGISTPAHMERLAGVVEGAIVGAGMVDCIEKAGPAHAAAAVAAYVRELRGGASIPAGAAR